MGHKAGEGLTDQRILFCHNYLKYKFNGTKAAEKAGYSKATARAQAADLLTIPSLRNYIDKLIKEQLSEIDKMTLEWLQDVTAIQKANIADFLKYGDDGLEVKDINKLSKSLTYAISEITDMGGGKVRIKLESKPKALELKARYLSLLGDNNQAAQTKKDKETIEEKKERLARLLKKNEVEDEPGQD